MGGMYEESIRAEFTHQTESFARNRVATSAETLDVVVDLWPKDPEAYILKGDALFDQNPRDGTAPLENYKKAMELDALNAKPVARKAFMYYRAKNFPSSIEEYTNAIA
jgi:Flp pilus assembly protein TadD